jgi:hypothetical protein
MSSSAEARRCGFCGSIGWQNCLVTGKKQGISPIQPFSAQIRFQNIYEFSGLQDEFPTQRSRELIRDDRELISGRREGAGNWLKNQSARRDEALIPRCRLNGARAVTFYRNDLVAPIERSFWDFSQLIRSVQLCLYDGTVPLYGPLINLVSPESEFRTRTCSRGPTSMTRSSRNSCPIEYFGASELMTNEEHQPAPELPRNKAPMHPTRVHLMIVFIDIPPHNRILFCILRAIFVVYLVDIEMMSHIKPSSALGKLIRNRQNMTVPNTMIRPMSVNSKNTSG